ncbi:hypothetical protein INT43_006960, partial [Umbelopsis isabellina]
MPTNSPLIAQTYPPHISTYTTDKSLIDPRDIDTPDEKVARSSHLIRLTGKHPFNAEPTPRLLDTSGFITPNELHFVRNHGAVADCDFSTHTVQISGEVNTPCTITMKDLLSMPAMTLPVTMVCAGNRRKEVNKYKQTVGFNWGAAGVSTARWTGVPLREVLKTFGGGLTRKAKYVCLEGCDKTSKGPYGTSISSERAMNDFYDVILAYKMNGKWLPPDHGFPLRVVVPGCVGGRSVKWLTEISVSEQDSQNEYHFYDNKVFPSHVDKDMADAERWWYKPDFAIYDLNINSAILYPYHADTLPLSRALTMPSFTLRGYAYSGKNNNIIRVELSFDSGKTWELTSLTQPELDEPLEALENYDSGYPRVRRWCWTLWSHSIKPTRLLRCKEICVRAWDETMNTQPGNFSWNLMGMFNNCWFKIKVDVVDDADGGFLRFSHPTIAGSENGGWMDSLQAAEPKVEEVANASKADNLPMYTIKQVESHNKQDDCWIVVKNIVYNCTPFMNLHPGGIDSIGLVAGEDCTEDFEAIHSTSAKEMLLKYAIGNLQPESPKIKEVIVEQLEPQASVVKVEKTTTTPFKFLNPKVWKIIVLHQKENISPDTWRYVFHLPDSKLYPGLPVGKHVYLRGKSDGKFIVRPYTPSSCSPGVIEFIVKVYKPNQQYTQGGLFSQYMDSLQIGDIMETKGPIGNFQYLGTGLYEHTRLKYPRLTADVACICAGTGITPIWQVMKAIIDEGANQFPRISLIYGNRCEEDIILRQQLEEMQHQLGPSRFSLRLVLSQPTPSWKHGKGRINREEINNHLFPFADTMAENSIVLLCGSDTM